MNEINDLASILAQDLYSYIYRLVYKECSHITLHQLNKNKNYLITFELSGRITDTRSKFVMNKYYMVKFVYGELYKEI